MSAQSPEIAQKSSLPDPESGARGREKGVSQIQTENLNITEIFCSLQGESRTIGLPTVFVRLTGCPLRCVYCDTSYAFQGKDKMSLEEILATVSGYGVHHVTVTGGEPLAQKACLSLLDRLCDAGYEVSLETSGAIDVSDVNSRVVKVMDIKTPASGEEPRNMIENLKYMTSMDQVKFVISDHNDYLWAKEFLQNHELVSKCEILFSPVHGELVARDLADWIVEDRLPVRFQVQLHKILWGDERAR